MYVKVILSIMEGSKGNAILKVVTVDTTLTITVRSRLPKASRIKHEQVKKWHASNKGLFDLLGTS